jgi:hypothetical protein
LKFTTIVKSLSVSICNYVSNMHCRLKVGYNDYDNTNTNTNVSSHLCGSRVLQALPLDKKRLLKLQALVSYTD